MSKVAAADIDKATGMYPQLTRDDIISTAQWANALTDADNHAAIFFAAVRKRSGSARQPRQEHEKEASSIAYGLFRIGLIAEILGSRLTSDEVGLRLQAAQSIYPQITDDEIALHQAIGDNWGRVMAQRDGHAEQAAEAAGWEKAEQGEVPF